MTAKRPPPHASPASPTSYLSVLPHNTSDAELDAVQRALARLADDEVQGHQRAVACRGDDLPAEIIAQAGDHGLVVLTLRRSGAKRRVFGELARELARRSNAGLLLVGGR